MEFLVSANTDIGLRKQKNQDSLTVKVANTSMGKITMAVLCDGMGGLSQGEVASATVVEAFEQWFVMRLPELINEGFDDSQIQMDWEEILETQNRIIMQYGNQLGIKLGTTVVAGLFTSNKYYIINVGDSRAYQLTNTLYQITNDQTVVAREVARGNITPEEAERDPRKSILLQCIGASTQVYPEMLYGEVKQNEVYLFCSDGFRHEISPLEIFNVLNPFVLTNQDQMDSNTKYLIDLNKYRKEQDNISVIVVRTY